MRWTFIPGGPSYLQLCQFIGRCSSLSDLATWTSSGLEAMRTPAAVHPLLPALHKVVQRLSDGVKRVKIAWYVEGAMVEAIATAMLMGTKAVSKASRDQATMCKLFS